MVWRRAAATLISRRGFSAPRVSTPFVETPISSQLHPKTGRIRLVDQWTPPNADFAVNIEVARVEDSPLIMSFMLNETRTQEPICASIEAESQDCGGLFEGINERAAGSGLSLLMFHNDDLIGIRMTSTHSMPSDLIPKKFEIYPDYKKVIDEQNCATRKEQRISALLETMYEFAPQYLPPTIDKYFCMELIGIKPQYRGNLSLRFNNEMFTLAAAQGYEYNEVLCTAMASRRICEKMGMKTVLIMPYEHFKDNGERCFKSENTPDGCTGAHLMIGHLPSMGYPNTD